MSDTDTDTERTVVVDDELEEAVHWLDRELRDARKAMWEGKSGKAYECIQAAQDEFDTLDQLLQENTDQKNG